MRNTQGLVIAFGLAFSFPSLAASPRTRAFTAEVAEAKASLRERADEAFVSMWQGRPAEDPMPATWYRSVSHWLIPAYSLGACWRHVSDTDLANWMVKLDQIAALSGQDPTVTRASLDVQGLKLRSAGSADQTILAMSDASRSAYCRIELMAVRQFVAEM